jgi:HK97 gp10 family phage protein
MPTFPVAQATISFKSSRRHNDFRQLKKRVRSNAHRAAYNFARGTVKDAKVLAPKRTGFMASRIMWQKIKPGVFDIFVDGDTIEETGAYYAIYVEHGTRHMAAQPFFRPAIEMRKRIYKAEMKAVFRD